MFNNDALAALMDYDYSIEFLYNYNEWTFEFKKFNMGMASAQGTFKKLVFSYDS